MNTKEVKEGVAVNIYPAGKIEVDFGNDDIQLCYVAGKMNLHKIKILIGDRVKVEMDEFKGRGTNRIIRRL